MRYKACSGDGCELAFAQAKAIPLGDLVQLPVAMLQKKFYVRQLMDDCCEQSGIEWKPALELSTLESLLQMARNNVGGAILPQSYMDNIRGSGIRSIAIIDPVPQKDVGIVYRKDMYLSKTKDTFMKQLMQQYLYVNEGVQQEKLRIQI
ncbi:LysR substrate binding domain-containing protein [Paenibacillus sp. yr247]|uniref:LysR family transcriptional regulator substrate-binding protein n=1 Tax=Paenibacillus sp. yr247 TaxID=1761880 RepID=UPI00088CA146|nr:LysR substrate binding domain-containing protein [Paenibacillus sp. yr247]